ncbi:3-isopropylmalate dehydratase small subunit [Ramlibacter sp.]|uniref:3-isopropylmalate dehydratase small subunit n=1 Tax=Ramlibacter sp. TaxID=1917967 RepID=UPI003D0D394A
MDKFTFLDGLVAPLDRADVDTDQIIPKQFLTSIKRTGYEAGCFAEWRKAPDFVLNQPAYAGAQILLARANFGCGSSREHAPWALRDFGFRAVVAPSFGEIFFNNATKNGVLPVALAEPEVDELFRACAASPSVRLRIDLERQSVTTADGARTFCFNIDPFRKYCLLNGLDEIGLTLRHEDKIRAFEERRRAEVPWNF